MLTCLLLPFCLPAQQYLEVKGHMYDSETMVPLEDGHIYVDGTKIGTISDDEGNFHLKIPDTYNKGKLKASYVGYTTFEKDLNSIEDPFLMVSMSPSITVLPELVFIYEEPYAIRHAIAQAREDYENEEALVADFYSELFKMDDDFSILKKLLNELDLDVEQLLKARLN